MPKDTNPTPEPNDPARHRCDTFEDYRRAEVALDHQRSTYIEDGKSNYEKLAPGVASHLRPSAAKLLNASNVDARIAFTRIALREIEALVADLSPATPLFFVTITPRDFAMRESVAAGFDPKALRRWVKAHLAGLSFIGIIEGAFYPNWPRRTVREGEAHIRVKDGTVGWHVHLVVWGKSRSTIDRRLAEIRTTTEAFVPGADVANCQELPQEAVTSRVLYISKSPCFRYNIIPPRGEKIDPKTGEIIASAIDRHQQRKEGIRSGELVRITNVMQDQYLDRLLVGGGEGKAVRKRIKALALVPLRAKKERQKDRRNANLDRLEAAGAVRP